MKVHRFIIDSVLSPGVFDIRDPDLVHQIADVLHLKEGERVILGDGKGREADGTIRAVGSKAVGVELGPVRETASEPVRRVILYAAIAKRENFEWIAQKATEVGVAEIAPLITDRTVKLDVKRERLEKIIREAAEQSGRGIVPTLHEPMSFKQAIAHAENNQRNFFFDVSGSAGDMSGDETAGVFIGPEGGWSEEERTAAKHAGFFIAGLGPLVLRAETAAVVASYLATSIISPPSVSR